MVKEKYVLFHFQGEYELKNTRKLPIGYGGCSASLISDRMQTTAPPILFL
jgi:hypothetical protein